MLRIANFATEAYTKCDRMRFAVASVRGWRSRQTKGGYFYEVKAAQRRSCGKHDAEPVPRFCIRRLYGGGISPDAVTVQELDAENAAEVTKTFEVKDGTEFVAALNEINADTSGTGNYVIKLAGDVALDSGSNYLFKYNTTTILGEDHSISGGNGLTLGVEGSAVLNLGTADYKRELILKGVSDFRPTGPLLYVTDSASANMYDGVTLQDHKVSGSDAGVQLNGHAQFIMYGGTIKNCEVDGSFPNSSVGAHDYSTFTMKDGSIENCSAYYGGGVIVAYGTFIMEGGSIENCTATLGGGICAIQGTIDLSNGTITGNKATYGGGLLLSDSKTKQAIQNCTITGNSAQIGGGIVLMDESTVDLSGTGNVVCNNTATSGGADIFLDEAEDDAEDSSITLPDAAAMGQTYGTSDKKIDGWYVDDPQYTPSEDAVAVDISKPLTGELALVASYKVHTDYTVTLLDEDNETLDTLTAAAGETVTLNDPANLPEGKMVTGWKAVEPADLEITKGKDGRWCFVMPDADVTLQVQLKNIQVDPDQPADDDASFSPAAAVGAAAVVAAGGAVIYTVGTQAYLESVLPAGAAIPTSRQALAALLWTDAGKPEPASTVLYTDVDADDADAQKADRWCVEQGLLKDRGEETFRPALYVTRVQVIKAWNAAQNLKNN